MADMKKNLGQVGEVVKAGADKAKAMAETAITPEQMQEFLDFTYEKVKQGIPNVSRDIDSLAKDYLSKNESIDAAVNSLIRYQLAKCTTSGFLAGLGGFFTLPYTLAAIPANITSVLYCQMRMVAAIAKMGGYDLKTDQVKTLVYVCMTGNAANEVLKNAGVDIGMKIAEAGLDKIPGALLTKINQTVGFRLITKAGTTGTVNLADWIPVAGGFVSGGFDLVTTKAIAETAKKMFIEKKG